MARQTTDPRILDTSIGSDGTRYDVYGMPADSPLPAVVEPHGCPHTYAPECLCRMAWEEPESQAAEDESDFVPEPPPDGDGHPDDLPF